MSSCFSDPPASRVVTQNAAASSHICLVYDDPAHYRREAFDYICDGLHRHEKCIMATDAYLPAMIEADFASHQMRLSDYLTSGQLTILRVKDSYAGDGGFEPEKTIRIWQQAVRQAQDEGYQALRVVGEATFALGSPELEDKLLYYENLLNQDIFPHYAMNAMCVYDKVRYPSKIIKAVIKAHPVLMYNQKIYHHNVYYIPPEIFFGERRGRDEIDRWLENVEKNNAAIEALYESEKRFRDMIDFLPVPVGTYDFDFNGKYANQAAFDFFGYTPDDMAAGISLLDLVPDTEKQRVKERMQCLCRGDNPGPLEMPLRKKDGSLAYGQIFPSPVLQDGRPVGVRTCFMDLTERREKERERQRLEEQLLHAQKMEAIGTLAGGIAHDFNNILSSIIGFAQLALEEVETESELHDDLNEIYRAGIRAANLVKQILSISRPQKHENRPFHVVPLLKEALKMLRATIPSSIEFQTHLDDPSLVIHGDPNQLHQVIVNLVTNAALAMSDHGGTLEVILKRIDLHNEQKTLWPELAPGDYARLTVRDTGVGIPAEHLAKIFEPYFTTREKREGTGLGLSIVHSIVKSHKGHITVASEPEKETVFHVYLPLVVSPTASSDRLPDNDVPPRGTGHLLFADDEASIVKMQRLVLEGLGYTITAVTSSLESLETVQATPHAFDMVITDMTMPHMTGDVLAREIKTIRPDLPVMLCTGFTSKLDALQQDPAIDMLMMKPTDKLRMAITIRKMLQQRHSA